MTTNTSHASATTTPVTWESIGNVYGDTFRRSPDVVGFAAAAGLVDELAARVPHLSRDEIRTLMDFTRSGMPLILTWDTPRGEDRIERTRTACIAEYISAPGELGTMHDVRHTGYVRVRYVGFERHLYLADLRKVEHFKAEHTYLPADGS